MKKNFLFTLFIAFFLNSPSFAGQKEICKDLKSTWIGQSGNSVLVLKRFINESTVFKVEENNYFDKYTESILKKIQKSYGIRQTGVLGPQTISKIKKSYKCDEYLSKIMIDVLQKNSISSIEKYNILNNFVLKYEIVQNGITQKEYFLKNEDVGLNWSKLITLNSFENDVIKTLPDFVSNKKIYLKSIGGFIQGEEFYDDGNTIYYLFVQVIPIPDTEISEISLGKAYVEDGLVKSVLYSEKTKYTTYTEKFLETFKSEKFDI